jgi:type IV secretory pathway VirB3-like protein
MVFAVVKTCLSGITVESNAPTETVVAILTSSKAIVNVPADPAVLTTIISVTTAVVEDGTVYKVVVVVVVAAPRKSALVSVAISYYLSFRVLP